MANTPYVTTSPAQFNVPGPCLIGDSTSDYIGFYGTTPIARRASAVQVAVGTTASTTTSAHGYATGTQADAIFTTLNEVVATLTALGLWKGGA